MSQPRVAVLGAGVWGVSFAFMAARSGQPVMLWSSNATKRARLREQRNTEATAEVQLFDNVVIPEQLSEALTADLIVVAMQPDCVRSSLAGLAGHFRPEQMVVHLAKGFEPSGTPLSKVIQQETRVLMTGAVAGPIVPAELWAGKDAAIIVGSAYQRVIDELTDLIASPRCRVYGNLDITGVEVAGAMRTPIAIAAGALRGQRTGLALASVLLTRGLAETARLITALGGDQRTASGLSGIGDWMLTAADPSDPLIQAGVRLAEGEDFGWDEAASRVRTLIALGERAGTDLPITRAVGSMLDGVPVARVVQGLMERSSRGEIG